MADPAEAPTHGAGNLDPERRIAIAFLGDPNSVHVRRWAGYFAARGHRITLLAPESQVISPGIPAEIAVDRFVPHTARRMRRLGMLAAWRSVREALDRVRPDVLHVHHLTVNGFRAWSSGFHPYVVTVWGNDVLIDPRRSRRAWLLARISLRSADLVTGISRHVLEAAIAAGAKPGLCHRIHFGVDVDRFAPGPDPSELRARLGLAGKRVLFSPRIIEPIYRHEVVIEALAQLPGDVSLVMSGYLADPAERTVVERHIAERGLAARVRIISSIPYAEMPDYYRLADAVISVPESDAGPVTLVEALAVGRPVVSSDLPPVREWLADLDPACLVPVGDVAATVAAVESVLSRGPQERGRFAESGRAAVRERADERSTMAEMERLYLELAAGRLIESAE
jgi:glycosyltransferase involved in cell wall biosynthesis